MKKLKLYTKYNLGLKRLAILISESNLIYLDIEHEKLRFDVLLYNDKPLKLSDIYSPTLPFSPKKLLSKKLFNSLNRISVNDGYEFILKREIKYPHLTQYQLEKLIENLELSGMSELKSVINHLKSKKS